MAKAAVRGLLLLPEKAKTMEVNQLSQDLLEAYKFDLPDPDALFAELRLWKTKWNSNVEEQPEDAIPHSVEETLRNVRDQERLFPNITQVLKLLLVTPVTTASVERANSALGFVKSDRRSSMTSERLNSLVRLFVHRDISLDFDKIITAYANKHPRRMLLNRPLDV